MSLSPPLIWAQDKIHVFVTIKLAGVEGEDIKFESQRFLFKGKAKEAEYDIAFELFQEISPVDRETKCQKVGGYWQLTLRKRDSRIWWPRLAKTSQKLHNVGVDWSKWIEDEDADAVEAKDDSEGIDLPNCADCDFTSSDDEDDEKPS
jgi:hypothetical protein